ncbi:MAG: hypothetical protein LBU99_02805 [Spirochaetaceae bacterium]|jgi:hypothetical protein|nr:hypothetical protein [Spirochaetaceae bacterium]
MKRFNLLAISGAMLIIGFALAGCASMSLVSVDPNVTGPSRVRQGQDIDPKLIVVNGLYKDGLTRAISVSQSSITFNKHTPGPQTVLVRVGIINTQVVSFDTEVMALKTLTVSAPPRTTIFKLGEIPNPSWPGLEVRGEWDQMGSDRIDLSQSVITGFIENQDGKQTIAVSYEGLTAVFDIDIRAMTAINIAQAPTKLVYLQDEALDLTGLRVTGVWDGFPEEELSVTMQDITGYNPTFIGNQHITVTKNGKIANFDIELLGLTSIQVDRPPNKETYLYGETLDLTGMQVMGNYTGRTTTEKRSVVIPVEQLEATGFSPNLINERQRVTITKKGTPAGGPSGTIFVTVVLPPPPAQDSAATTN